MPTVIGANREAFNAAEMERRDPAGFSVNIPEPIRSPDRRSGMVSAVKVAGKHMAEDGNELPQHIAKLVIPPAWNDVKYNNDPNGTLLALGKDAKGRDQYIYHPEFQRTQAEAKFRRIDELNDKWESIKKQNDEKRGHSDPVIADSADAMHLIMHTGIRPGSNKDTGAAQQAYGASTLEGRHIINNGDNMSLSFVGKKGVPLNIPITDSSVKQMLSWRKEAFGDEGKLFPNTNSMALLSHVHGFDGGGFKTKDFRTLIGTRSAMDEIDKMPSPENEKEYKKAVAQVAKTVSKKLGNTPTVALQSYINPVVFSKWRKEW